MPPEARAPAWEALGWDSEFFGFGVGRITTLPDSFGALQDTLSDARAAGMRLLYLTHPADREELLAWSGQAGGFRADLKRTYGKAVAGEPASERVVPYADDPLARRQLRRLAWEAAVESRFRVDPSMPPGAWRRLYGIWIGRSVTGAIADAVLTEVFGNRLRGMITLSSRSGVSNIGLLAVAAADRGQGIGSALLRSADAWAADHGCSRLEVVTQGTNRAACRAYEAAGYTVVADQWVHHFWLGKP